MQGRSLVPSLPPLTRGGTCKQSLNRGFRRWQGEGEREGSARISGISSIDEDEIRILRSL